MKQIHNRDIPEMVSLLLPFSAHSTTGAWHTDFDFSTGRLSEEWRDQLLLSIESDGLAYVVQSYATPIGWWTKSKGWTIPDEKYSQTTSCAQGRLRAGAAAHRGQAA